MILPEIEFYTIENGVHMNLKVNVYYTKTQVPPNKNQDKYVGVNLQALFPLPPMLKSKTAKLLAISSESTRYVCHTYIQQRQH